MGLRHATDAWGEAGPTPGGAATQPATHGYGPLIPDPQQVLDLPEGFTYRVISRMGMEMDDGLVVPGKHDGAATFPGPDGLVIHICNHECDPTLQRLGPYGWSLERLHFPALDRIYDRGYGQTPALGGCTTTVYDPGSGNVVRRYHFPYRQRAELRRRAHAVELLAHVRGDHDGRRRAAREGPRLRLRGPRPG